MRYHGIRWAVVAAALAALAAAPARAFDYGGDLGLGYDRIESWSGDDHGLVPRLRFGGNLDVNHFFVAPGIVDLAARVGYDNFRSKYGSTDSRADGLSYAASLGVLQNRTSRAQLAASASRSQSDFSSDVDMVRNTGSLLRNAYSVSASESVPGLPSLRAAFTHDDSLSKGLDRPDVTNTARDVDLIALFGPSGLSSQVNYHLRWEEGSLVPTNYTTQWLRLNGASLPTDAVIATVSASYYQRDPAELGALNPRYENTNFGASAGGQNSKTGRRAWASYTYDHAMATDQSLRIHDSVNNGLSANYAFHSSPRMEWIGTVSGSLGQTQLADRRASASGESAGVTGRWTSETYIFSLGSRLGALQPDSGDATLAYGVSGSGSGRWQRANHGYVLSYSANYDSNLDASPGWSTFQALTAQMTTTVSALLSWSARLQGSASRAGGGAFGDSATRSISAQGVLAYWRATFSLEAGTSDGAAGALSNPFSDGLFIPPGFDTHSRYAAATASAPLLSNLTALATAKYAIILAPGTPDQREASLGGSLRYRVGYWTFSIDERYTTGGTTSFDNRVNEIYFRTTRTFGRR